ncbi:MAG: radical SAM protein [Actinomycetia bacterium]|nr:radical SAM protein [Actinomycetes bacterium]
MFYGPVLSRRFGYSLGVDIIPFKVCVYNCIYCQLGPTTEKTTSRKRYLDIDLDEFGKDLNKKIKEFPYTDYVTFSGSGEPTLNSDIDRLIEAAKLNSLVPVVVLTSGGTLGLEGVAEDLKNADIVKVSLDACSQEMLEKINCPAEGVRLEKNMEGIKRLINISDASIWLEIMIMAGINDDMVSAKKFKDIIEDFRQGIEKIHLNTAVRPSGKGYMRLPERKRLEQIKDVLGQKAEIIGKVNYGKYSSNLVQTEQEIEKLIKRRPVTIADISSALGINRNEAIKICDKLMSEEKIDYSTSKNEKYYIKPRIL